MGKEPPVREVASTPVRVAPGGDRNQTLAIYSSTNHAWKDTLLRAERFH